MALVVAASAMIAVAGQGSGTAYLGVYLEGREGHSIEGVHIIGVVEDGPAQEAGIQEGDVIIGIDGQAVEDFGDLTRALEDFSPGDTVGVDLDRDGKTQSRTVTLGSKPKNKHLKRFHKDHGLTFDFDFGGANTFFSKGPGCILGGKGCCLGNLGSKIHEIIGDLVGKGIDVKVDCDEGKCKVIVEVNGETKTYEFDCTGIGRGAAAFLHFGDDDDHDVHVFSPGAGAGRWFGVGDDDDHGDLRSRLHKALAYSFGPGHGKAKTTFEVDKDGTITAITRKRGNELKRKFEDEQDLADRSPELHELYSELVD